MKTVAMTAMLEDLGIITYGRSRQDAIRYNTCVRCGENAENFRNEICEREFQLTALCQTCQDNIFDNGYE